MSPIDSIPIDYSAEWTNLTITAVDLNLLVKAIRNPEASDSAAHRLIHLNVADDFCIIHYLLASEYVTEQVYLHLYDTKRNELLQFLAVPHGEGDLGVLRGVLFERYAHTVISSGGVFRIRELTDSNLSSTYIQLPELPQPLFDNDSDVSSNNDCYFRPRINFF